MSPAEGSIRESLKAEEMGMESPPHQDDTLTAFRYLFDRLPSGRIEFVVCAQDRSTHSGVRSDRAPQVRKCTDARGPSRR